MRALLLAALIACGPAPKPAAPTVMTTGPSEPITTAPAANPGLPDTAEGHMFAWVLGVLDAHHGQITKEDVAARFAPSFLAVVPADQLVATFAQLAPSLAGAHVVRAEPKGGGLLVRLEAPAGRFDASLMLDAGKISGLLFRPVVVESIDEAMAVAPTLAPKVSLLVAELDGSTCRPIHAIASGDELAIGSAFKLYVLLALADQVQRGKLKWDQELAVRDAWKSLPSGITQNDAAGTKLTIRTLAERMISISDNTATDHLLYTVGRKNVEAALHTAKHAQPLLDTPMLGTRELFLFRLGLPDEATGTYVAQKAAQRRAYLDTLATKPATLAGADTWDTGRHIDQLEWFASPMDLCNVMVALRDRATKVPAVLDVLAINPGLPQPKTTWPYVGFKGGSEPGVVSGTWLLKRDDGKQFVVSLTANAPSGPSPDQSKLYALAQGVIELVAKEQR